MADADDSSDKDDLSPEDLRDLIDVQREELEVEKEKQETRRMELESQERQAKRALEAQLQDREQQREFQDRKSKREQRYGLGYVALFLIFFGYLVWLGYTEIVYEIIRILVYGGAGWAAGNSVGRAQARRGSANGNGQ